MKENARRKVEIKDGSCLCAREGKRKKKIFVEVS